MWREGEKRFFGPSTRARGLTTCGSSKLGPHEPRLQGWTGDGSRRRTTRITFAVPSLQANIIAPDTSRPEESRADEVLRSHNRLNLHPYRDGYRGKCPVHGGGGSTCTKGEAKN